MHHRLCALLLMGAAAVLVAAPGVASTPARAPGASYAAAVPLPSMSPDDVFYKIREVFRSHRPPPPYETYTLVRQNDDAEGYPDYADSYTFHIWMRTSDKAALGREFSRLGAIGQMEFMRPQFNSVDAPEDHPELADPGPPTADLFEPAPAHPHPISWVPTPEPTGTMPPVIGRVNVSVNADYYVVAVNADQGLLHVVLTPRRDPERNRLRELWVDPRTFELEKVLATDRFEYCVGHRCETYPTLFTITLGRLDGMPVVTHIHGVVEGGYNSDDRVVEYSFENIAFPHSLPSWYFDPRDYAAHIQDAPT
ncbi:MAG: hypothetical protein ACYC8W_08505 [Candidatus Tyrphobacter sp.]